MTAVMVYVTVKEGTESDFILASLNNAQNSVQVRMGVHLSGCICDLLLV